jgi:hypothetical protein
MSITLQAVLSPCNTFLSFFDNYLGVEAYGGV